jgi:hypothetical protein
MRDESLGKSLGESLEELLPGSNRPVAKLLHPSKVLTARERERRERIS